MAEPIARGECDTCGQFFIYKAKQIRIWFKQLPQKPEASFCCPNCNKKMVEEISFKSAYLFANMGCTVKHYYDDKKDIQPISLEEVEKFIINLNNDEEFWRQLDESS
jgi:hypothetical protein